MGTQIKRDRLVITTFLAVSAMAPLAVGSDVPTRILDGRANASANEPGFSIRAVAAGGADAVAAVRETPSKKTSLWHSKDRGAASAVMDFSEAGRTTNFIPARLESHLGISSAGAVCFSADLSPTPGGTYHEYRRFFDSVWAGPPPVPLLAGREGDVVPASAASATTERRWRFTSWPGITYSGTPYWMAGEADIERGPSVSRGIYAGSGAGTHRVLGTGTAVLPDQAVISAAAGAIDSYSVSPLGSSAVAVVRVDRGPAGTQELRVVRRAVEGSASPSTLLSQGTGWNGLGIRRFYLPVSGEVPGCGHPATWAVALDTVDSTERDSIVIKDGQKAYQEGDVIDGRRLAGPPLALCANASGDILTLWGAAAPGTNTRVRTTAFLNGSCILAFGDPVDTDGDGVAETASRVTHIAPLGALSALASDGKVSVYLSVEINDAPALVRIRVPGLPRTGSADFNGDGDSGTDADIEAFFHCLAGDCCTGCSADFNGDGDSGTDADIEAFFRVLAGGNC